jgi:hypothetical protein
MDLDIPAVTEVAVSLFFPGKPDRPPPRHLHNTTSPRKATSPRPPKSAKPVITQAYCFIAGVDVAADAAPAPS